MILFSVGFTVNLQLQTQDADASGGETSGQDQG